MKRAGIFIFLMAAIGLFINWNDFRGGDVDFDVEDYQELQIILGVFLAAGLGLAGFGFWNDRKR